jgi:hypothetical protein
LVEAAGLVLQSEDEPGGFGGVVQVEDRVAVGAVEV